MLVWEEKCHAHRCKGVPSPLATIKETCEVAGTTLYLISEIYFCLINSYTENQYFYCAYFVLTWP